MRRIPTNEPFTIPRDDREYRFINYGKFCKDIFVILLDDKGNWADFQACGTACNHHKIRGFVYKTFHSKIKWFNPTWWYHMTCWGTHYPMKLYFNHRKDTHHAPKWDDNLLRDMPIGPERTKYVMDKVEAFNKWSLLIADKNAIPVEYILYKILGEVRRKTHIQFELDFENFEYGDKWGEAFLPLKYKGKKYLLTWQNCD